MIAPWTGSICRTDREAVRLEVVEHVRRDEPLRPREALEAEIEQAADGAARAVGADGPRRPQLALAAGRRDRRGHAAAVLRQPAQARVEEHLRPGDALEVAQRDGCKLVLPEVDVVRVVRVVREELEVERDPLAGLVDEVGVVLLAEPLLLGLAQDAEAVEVLQNRPVVDHRPGRVDDVRLGLHDGHSQPTLREAERRDEADRARARDQHTLVSFHGGSLRKSRHILRG